MDNREVERRPSEFSATCHSMGRTAQARLLNISPLGCLLRTDEEILRSDRKIRIKIPGLASLDGTVVWCEDARAGVEFAVAQHPAVVEYIAGRTAAEVTRDPTFRGRLDRVFASLCDHVGVERRPAGRTVRIH